MLGFAVGAGILVLAAVVAAVAGFKLFKKFVGGAA